MLLQGALRRSGSEDQLLAETEMTFDMLYEPILRLLAKRTERTQTRLRIRFPIPQQEHIQNSSTTA